MKSIRKKSKLKRITIGATAVLFLVVTIISWPLLVPHPSNPAKFTLHSAKKVFAATDHPTLRLKAQKPAHLGFWYVPVVYATTEPTVDVTYDDKKIDVPTTITPDGADYVVTVDPDGQPKAGAYTVTVSVREDSGAPEKTSDTFVWGVLAVNFDKSVYAPGEIAHVQMAALDSSGHTLCSAPLQLTITDPAGQSRVAPYNPSNMCHGDSFVSVPDYTVDYQTTVVGNYQVKLAMQDTDYVIGDSFRVSTDAPFSVQRQALSRLYPVHAYGMHFTITPAQNFTGDVTEVLPTKDFKITSAPGATLSSQDDKPVLTWHVNWQTGKIYDFGYEYTPPLQSPAAYVIKPLTFAANGTPVFTESRGWQLVNDAAITVVKQTEVDVQTAALSKNSAVTSTGGNTLVLQFAEDVAGSSNGLNSVTDSAGNTWTLPGANPNQNPPQNFASGTSSVVAMAYKTNASAITSITVTINGVTTQRFAFNVIELSNVDDVNPVMDSSSSNATAATTQTSSSVTVATCDAPATAAVLRGGSYFCGPDTVIVIGVVEGGTATPSVTTSGFADTNLMSPTSTGRARGAYNIVTTSASYNITYSFSVSKACGMGIMAFAQKPSGNLKRGMYWAK